MYRITHPVLTPSWDDLDDRCRLRRLYGLVISPPGSPYSISNPQTSLSYSCSTIPKGGRPEDSWDQRNLYSHFNIWVDYNHSSSWISLHQVSRRSYHIWTFWLTWCHLLWHHGIGLNLTKKFNKKLLRLFKRICDVFLVNKSLKEHVGINGITRPAHCQEGWQGSPWGKIVLLPNWANKFAAFCRKTCILLRTCNRSSCNKFEYSCSYLKRHIWMSL